MQVIYLNNICQHDVKTEKPDKIAISQHWFADCLI